MQKCLLMWVARTISWSSIALVLASPAASAILASTFGPGDTFLNGPPYIIGNSLFQAEIAAPFTPGYHSQSGSDSRCRFLHFGLSMILPFILRRTSAEQPGRPLESFTDCVSIRPRHFNPQLLVASASSRGISLPGRCDRSRFD